MNLKGLLSIIAEADLGFLSNLLKLQTCHAALNHPFLSDNLNSARVRYARLLALFALRASLFNVPLRGWATILAPCHVTAFIPGPRQHYCSEINGVRFTNLHNRSLYINSYA